MSLEKIKQKILDEAEIKRQEIINQYEAKIAEIKKKTDAEIKNIYQTAEQQSKIEAQSILDRTATEAKLEQRKLLLKAKWEIIDNIFATAERRFLELPEYLTLLKDLITRHTSEENCEVIINPDDKAQIANQFPNVRLIEDPTIKGGIIIRTGRTEMNFTLDALLCRLKEELIIELAKILFST
ncbi:MAG: V-type ATP synthase subunit E [candidate division WOR-3 bacterium]